jgi:hypothetical protein
VEKKAADPMSLASQMSKKEELIKSKEKIEQNLDQSKKALEKHSQHVKELKSIVKGQSAGAAKDELKKVLDSAEKHVDDLEAHIKQGEKLVEEKEDAIDDITSKIKTTNVGDVEAARQIKKDKEQKSESIEKIKEQALDDPVKTGKKLSKAQLKDRAKAAKDLAIKSKEQAEELREEADSLKPDVAKAEDQIKVLEKVKAESTAQEGSKEHQNLVKSLQQAKDDLDEANKKVADKLMAASEQESKVLQSQNLIENTKEQI